jgi:tetratricopeptide (TPR) repeat protein
MRVAVYTVAKNEAKQVQPFTESCRDADLVVIADTGSTDGTPDLLRQAGAVVHSIAVTPWRFDVARTTALALLPADVDVCIKLDLDERLQPGWRAELERAWVPGTTRLRYWYTWNWKAPGVPDVVFRSDLIHARAGYIWRYPTHEILDNTVPQVIAESELAIHQFPEAKPRPNDLPLLELAARENRCSRTLFYLGREHSFRQEWPACQKVLEDYLLLPDARWTPERSHAMRLIGWCRKHQDDLTGATAWFLRACAEDPYLRENWLDLAEAFHSASDWSGCYHACERALAIRERPRHYQSFGYAWGARAADLAAVCASFMGMKEKAAEHMRVALSINPADPRLQSNAKFIMPEAQSPEWTPPQPRQTVNQAAPPRQTIWNLEEAKKCHVHSPSFANLLLSIFPKEDGVIDFGCGLGYYAAFLRDHGYTVSAIEGTEGINEISLFKGIRTFDLSQPLSFTLSPSSVLCLEVGEHLLPSQEGIFLDNITKFCKRKMVLSWAVPGQTGHGHHNERPNDYIISQLAKRGFEFDKEQSSYLRENYVRREAWWLYRTLMVFNRT